MRQATQSVITLLLGLTLFYNLERLDIGKENIINIDSFVYVLGIIAVISIIKIPMLRRSNLSVSITLWVGLYFSAKFLLWALFDGRPLLGGIQTYLSITEISLLILLIWLARGLASSLYDFEEAIEKITFSAADKRIRQLYEANEEIQIEMFRSRNNHSPLSIIVVEPDPESIQITFHQLVQEVQRTMSNGYFIKNMAKALSKYLRPTDLILEQRDRGRFILFCPETNARDSRHLVDHIQAVANEHLGASVTYGIATFPDEAVTFDELLHQAELHLKHQNNNIQKENC